MVVARGHNATSPPVIDESINSFLKHALLIADDYLGRTQLHKAPQTVVPVDYPAIEVVEVANHEAPAVQLDYGPQRRRQYRKDGQNCPLRLVLTELKRFDQLQPLTDLLTVSSRSTADLLTKLPVQSTQIELLENLQNSLSPHTHLEDSVVLVLEPPVLLLIKQLPRLKTLHFLNARLQFLLEPLISLCYPSSKLVYLSQPALIILDLSLQFLNLLVQTALVLGSLPNHCFLEFDEPLLLRFLIDRDDDIAGKIDYSLQIARRQVEEKPHPTGHQLHKPYMSDRRSQFYVPYAFPAYTRVGYLNATLITRNPLVPRLLVLSAVALEILDGTEDPLAEESVPLRLKRTVVYRLRFGHFAMGPALDLLR